ncbi:MAG: PEP-utilizing enzyme [Oscillospiraceae bacterium]|jgi:phosphotransferase system enzyme I (PtsI)|nr:PEP-utilizing enzyme [Oscillospiraceae bacterium]MDD3261293.1 phosphoenolpyruvate-utilizing N-terminal domain-containing protein [Oscillospiraceae bacterium]
MRILQGTAASGGVAIGPAFVVTAEMPHLVRQPVRKPAQELERLKGAFAAAQEEIEKIYENACKGIGEEESLIFRVHIMMLQDENFRQEMIDSIVQDHTSAEYAVWRAGHRMYDMFSKMENEYMRARGEDMMDISRRLLRCLDQRGDPPPEYLHTPVILCMAQALPSEIARTYHSKILGFIAQHGSTTAHSAILVRSLHKPAVLGLGEDFWELRGCRQVIVDGYSGQVVLDPDTKTRDRYARLLQEENLRAEGSRQKHEQET